MKTRSIILTGLFCLVLFSWGCTRLVLRSSGPVLEGVSDSFFDECDLEFARASLPGNLKLLEGLLREDTGNRKILKALCLGFTGYSMLIRGDETARESAFLKRARDYGLMSLWGGSGHAGDLLHSEGRLADRLKETYKKDVETLFWVASAWNRYIALNLQNPKVIAQMPLAESCLQRVLELDPGFLFSAPRIVMGSVLAAKPEILGGDRLKAKQLFQDAFEEGAKEFLMAHYYYARYYAVRVQDRELFRSITREALERQRAPESGLCLINGAMKEKIMELKEMEDELFF